MREIPTVKMGDPGAVPGASTHVTSENHEGKHACTAHCSVSSAMEVPRSTCARAPQPGDVVEYPAGLGWTLGVLMSLPLPPCGWVQVEAADGRRTIVEVPPGELRPVLCAVCEAPMQAAPVRCSAGCSAEARGWPGPDPTIPVEDAPEPPEAEDPVRAVFQLMRPDGPLSPDVLVALAGVVERYERACTRLELNGWDVGANIKHEADRALCEVFALIGGAR